MTEIKTLGGVTQIVFARRRANGERQQPMRGFHAGAMPEIH